jgi:hypothetical protein
MTETENEKNKNVVEAIKERIFEKGMISIQAPVPNIGEFHKVKATVTGDLKEVIRTVLQEIQKEYEVWDQEVWETGLKQIRKEFDDLRKLYELSTGLNSMLDKANADVNWLLYWTPFLGRGLESGRQSMAKSVAEITLLTAACSVIDTMLKD